MSSCVRMRVVEVDVQAQARVELVAADAREVVALGVEEQLVEQRCARCRRWAARPGAAS